MVVNIFKPILCRVSACVLLFALHAPAIAGGNPVVGELQRQDQILCQGTIIYRETYSPPPAAAANAFVSTDRLYFTAGGAFARIVSIKSGKSGSYEQIFDGTDLMTVLEHGEQVQFSTMQGPKPDKLTSMTPGPCLAIGHGLGDLLSPTLAPDAVGVHFVGRGSYGTTIEALLDPKHGYVATDVTRRNAAGVLISHWRLDSPEKVAPGIFIEKHSIYEARVGSGGLIKDEFNIDSFDIARPDKDLLTYDWRAPGKEIVDLRLGSTSLGIFNSDVIPAGTTASQLLKMTSDQIKERARLESLNSAARSTYDQQKATKPLASKILLLLLIVTTCAALIVRIMRNRNLPPSGGRRR